ncbi:hypothetical protein SprV_0301111500 [Sparganum proliferum]
MHRVCKPSLSSISPPPAPPLSQVEARLTKLADDVFVVSDIPYAICDADFLSAFNILVDSCQSLYMTRPSYSPSEASPLLTLPVISPPLVLSSGVHFGNSSPNTPASLVPTSAPPFHPATLFIRSVRLPTPVSQPHRLAPAQLTAANSKFEHDFASALFGKSVLSKIDLARVIHQSFIAAEDVSKTTATTLAFLGPWACRLNTYQSFADRVNRGLIFVYACIDDIVSSGHLVDSKGIRTPLSKVAAICDFTSLFQASAAATSRHGKYLSPVPPKLHRHYPAAHELPRSSFELSVDDLTAFGEAKATLTDATFLIHLPPDAYITILLDASDAAFGAALRQKLSPAETRYSTFGQELLAVSPAVKHFRHFPEDRDLTVPTDHKPFPRSQV